MGDRMASRVTLRGGGPGARASRVVCVGLLAQVGLVSCAHGNGVTAPASRPSCDMTVSDVEAAPLASVPGSRYVFPLPRGFERTRGGLFVTHPCGATIALAEAPIGMRAEESERFAQGLFEGVVEDYEADGASCEPSSESAVHCRIEGELVLLSRMPRGFASVIGPLPHPIAEAMLGRVTFDASRTYDPVRATGLAITPPAGLRLSESSMVSFLAYGESSAPSLEDHARPALLWTFVAYEVDEAGRSLEPSDEDIGRFLGQLARDELSVTSVDPGSAEATPIHEGRGQLVVMDARRGEVEVRWFLAFVRDAFGFFASVGSVPVERRAVLEPAFLEHYRAFAFAR